MSDALGFPTYTVAPREFRYPDDLLEAELPPRLYHYTDSGGLKGIVENRVLWSTIVYYFNDAREFNHG